MVNTLYWGLPSSNATTLAHKLFQVWQSPSHLTPYASGKKQMVEEASTQVTMALPPCSATNSFEGSYRKNPKSCSFKKVKGLFVEVLENYYDRLGFQNSFQKWFLDVFIKLKFI